MIVRISGEAQFRLPDGAVVRLNELDNQAVTAVEHGNEPSFRELLEKMVELVRLEGELLEEDELVESDVIVPPADSSFAEAAADFSGDGLIPG